MYGKIFESMYDGTLATRGPWQAIVTFQQMIVLCDKHGTVDMTPEAIARRTTIPLEIIQTGIAALELPDPESRIPDDDGRRLARLSDLRAWGWQIVNYLHYRRLHREEDRREYMRQYQRKRRADVNKNVNSVNNVTHSSKQYAVEELKYVGAPSDHPTDENPSTKKNGNPSQTLRGQRLSSDWRLPDEWKDWTLSAYPDLDPQKVVRLSLEFRDYWAAVPGSKGRKADWLATWRNNVRRKMGDA